MVLIVAQQSSTLVLAAREETKGRQLWRWRQATDCEWQRDPGDRARCS